MSGLSWDRHDLTAQRARRTLITHSQGRPVRVTVSRDRHIFSVPMPHDEAIDHTDRNTRWLAWLAAAIVACLFVAGIG